MPQRLLRLATSIHEQLAWSGPVLAGIFGIVSLCCTFILPRVLLLRFLEASIPGI